MAKTSWPNVLDRAKQAGIQIVHDRYCPPDAIYDFPYLSSWICGTRVWLQLNDDTTGLIAYDWQRLVQLQDSGG